MPTAKTAATNEEIIIWLSDHIWVFKRITGRLLKGQQVRRLLFDVLLATVTRDSIASYE